MTYYQAATILAKDAHAGLSESQIPPIPYWQIYLRPLGGQPFGLRNRNSE
jgi:hypothetical protein